MEPAKRFLEKAFAAWEKVRIKLSTRWRQHANRRTVLLLLVGGALFGYAYVNGVEPPDNFPTGQLVSVPAGASASQIATDLAESGAIRSPLMFRVVVTLLGAEHSLHQGDYLFKEPADVFSVARAISIGAYGLEPLRIRIPEGATVKEMAALYTGQLPRFDATTFLNKAQPLEGYLFPDTYFFLPNATADTVIAAMRQDFDLREATIAQQVASSTHSLSDIVIMASIVEKEARDTTDRRIIAGVLWNRIARGMPLQSDVPLVYALGKPDSELTRADLQSSNPYNTYTHKGLPPGPVNSPSLDSLLAAAVPIKTNYLYYLADAAGVTHYSTTYAGHLQNERLYLGK